MSDKEDKTKEKLFSEILNDISENGMSLRKAIKGRMCNSVFYEYLEENKENAERYARACEERAEAIADEILDIADETEFDTYTSEKTGEKLENREWISRSRLRIDARKFILAKQYPKKYGDSVTAEVTGKDGSPLIPDTVLSALTTRELIERAKAVQKIQENESPD